MDDDDGGGVTIDKSEIICLSNADLFFPNLL